MVFLSELEVCCSTNNPLFWLLVWSFSLLRWQSGAVERFPNVNRSSEAFQKERSTHYGSETKQGIVFFLLGGKGRLSDMSTTEMPQNKTLGYFRDGEHACRVQFNFSFHKVFQM